MPIALYDHALSGNCYKVRLLLGFLDLDHERVNVDFFPGAAHKTPEFLRTNPLGQLPALDDDGLHLRDSQAILCHLARKYDAGGTWLPRDGAGFSQAMMWLMFAATALAPAATARAHDLFGQPADIERARAAARAAMRVLDDHLVHRHMDGDLWLVGDRPTIADIACFPFVALAGDGGMDHDEYAGVRRWLRDFRSLPRFHTMPGIPEFL